MKIAILTGGGDAPGLNAVIYGVTRTALGRFPGCSVIGYKFGYRGLYLNDYVELSRGETSGIMHRGGTILYSSNRDNLFSYPVIENGERVLRDVSPIAVDNLKKEGVEVLVVLGGDGTLTSARDFACVGVNIIGVPKTIDNDLSSTASTFGFNTAVSIVTENLGRLHTTAESHHRVIVVEVMGRNAGWIALHSGISGSADIILLPEFPYKLEKIAEKIHERNNEGKPFTIVVVTEGAKPADGDAVVSKIVEDSPDPVRYGGIAAKLAHDLEGHVPNEVRSVNLGHIQRGGEPTAHDRLLSLRYASKAVDLIEQKAYGRMVCLWAGKMDSVALEEVIGLGNKQVQPDDELIKVAKGLGLNFGV
ncbi:MAG: ATP-dependent 6-phosphofructokinase [Defluviitaleaceae bacterium]|nr:ATP-dependent 6-phosphofructokinase [Defluviitaleaceae bacterium]